MIYGPKIGISCHSPLSLSKRHGNWPTQIVSEVSGDFLSLTHRLARLFDGSVPKKNWGEDISRLQLFCLKKKTSPNLLRFAIPPCLSKPFPQNKHLVRLRRIFHNVLHRPCCRFQSMVFRRFGPVLKLGDGRTVPVPVPVFLGGYNMTPTNKTMKPMPLNLPHTVFLYEVRSPPKWVNLRIPVQSSVLVVAEDPPNLEEN